MRFAAWFFAAPAIGGCGPGRQAAGAAPDGDRLTIDPDATRVATYPGKEGSAFSRTRGGAANVGRAMGAFIDEYRPRSRMAAAAGTGCGSGSTRPAISSR